QPLGLHVLAGSGGHSRCSFRHGLLFDSERSDGVAGNALGFGSGLLFCALF
ncbi:unnamed protein product, partial [Closterium sp. Yama58-4]